MCHSHHIPSYFQCRILLDQHVLPLQGRKCKSASEATEPYGAFLHLSPPFSLSLNVADGASKRTASCPPEAPLSITTSPPDMGSQKVPTRFRSCAEEELLRKSGTAPAKIRSERMPSHETLLSSRIVSWTTALAMPSPLICRKS